MHRLQRKGERISEPSRLSGSHTASSPGTAPDQGESLGTGDREDRDDAWARGAAPSLSELQPRRPWAGVTRVALLAAADGVALLMAGTAAFLLWAYPVRGQDPELYVAATPAISLILAGYGLAGLYPGFGLGPVEVLRRYVLVSGTAFLVLASLVFGLKLEDQYSRVTLVLALGLSLLFIGGLRWSATRWARRFDWWPEPVALIGDGSRTNLTLNILRDAPNREFRPVVVLAQSDAFGGNAGAGPGPHDPQGPAQERARVPVPSTALLGLARSGVEVAFADLEGPGSEAALDELRLLFPRVIIVREFEDLPVEGVQVRNLGGVLGLEYGNNLLRAQNRFVKRVLDLVVAGGTLLFTLPIMLAAMLVVRILSPGPALFFQPREGRRGQEIRVPKIRSMVPDAEHRMEELLEEDPALRQEWVTGFKLQDDPRVIPWVGPLIRRFSIDELPQLWSVVRGHMSLVGPRPFPAYHLEALTAQARRLRSEVRPGITGLWQVMARGDADVAAQQAYDMYYIRNWSIWLDLYIIVRTFGAVISGRGAY